LTAGRRECEGSHASYDLSDSSEYGIPEKRHNNDDHDTKVPTVEDKFSNKRVSVSCVRFL
jgi:hypothetical protein